MSDGSVRPRKIRKKKKLSGLKPARGLDASFVQEVQWIVGLDEVGRGCLAGPVVAGCFAYKVDADWIAKYRAGDTPVYDSKALSLEQRQAAAARLRGLSHAYMATAEASVEEVDALNIFHASYLAMMRALSTVRAAIESAHGTIRRAQILVDGNYLSRDLRSLPSEYSARAVVQGDSKSFAIAASSILAKIHRDSFMVALSRDFPNYDWHTNVGYATPAHREALVKHGPTAWHRRSFNLDFALEAGDLEEMEALEAAPL